MLSQLATLIMVAVTGAPGGDCPSDAAVASELQRLGALAAVSELGTAQVSVSGNVLSIVMRDHQGSVLGTRSLESPPSCEARAAVAAVLLAAWAGEWAKTSIPSDEKGSESGAPISGAREGASGRRPPATAGAKPLSTEPASDSVTNAPALTTAPTEISPEVAPPAPEVDEPVAQARAPAPAPPSGGLVPGWRSLAIDGAMVGSGTYDTDAGTWALAAQLAARGQRYSLIGLLETIGDRDRSLGTGSASYGAWRLGLGASARWTWSRSFLEVALVPELARHRMRGKNLTPNHQAVAWAPLADLRLSAGLQLGRWAPFVYLGANYSLMSERLTLDNAPDSARLARLNLAAGLGISFRLKNAAVR